MKSRLLAAAAVLACVIMTTTGCLAQPDPEPTPLFSSEEEAFAAAEATYRAYVDALNQVDLSDPETFEEVYAWTTGDANANERKTLSQMHADGWQVSGSTVVTFFDGDQATITAPIHVLALACTDVSAVNLVDATGKSVVPEDRSDSYALRLEFVESGTTETSLAIVASNAVEDARCNS